MAHAHRVIWTLAGALAIGASGVGCNDSSDPPPPAPPAITIAAISPVTGPSTGGTTVTITGSNFEAGAGVSFDGTAATAIAVVSGTTLTCTTPAGTAGPATFRVTNASGATAAEANGFTYTSGAALPPSVAAITLSSGPVAGGVLVTITGAAFETGATVTIGGTLCTGVSVATAGRIVCTTPAGAAPGQATVVVTNPDTQTGSLVNGYLYLASGALAPGFGTGGIVTVDAGAGGEEAYRVASDGSAIYVFGFDSNGPGGGSQWRIEKRTLASGALVSSFGAGGVVTTNPSPNYGFGFALLVVGSDLYVAGSSQPSGANNRAWWVEKRSLATGVIVPAFGVGGMLVINPSTAHDELNALATDGSNLYLVGEDATAGTANSRWRIEKRTLATGQLVPGFGSVGVVTSNPTAGADAAWGAVSTATGLHVVGSDSSGGGRWRIERRSPSTGALVTGFGTGGVVTSDPSTGSDFVQDVGSDGTDLYVFGNDESPGSGDSQWRIEKRSLATGALVAGFGTGGVVTSDPSSSWDSAASVLLDGTSLYTLGVDGSGSGRWRIERRALATGGFVTAFGTAGTVTSDPTPGWDVSIDAVSDGAYLYVVGFDQPLNPTLPGPYRWRIEKRVR